MMFLTDCNSDIVVVGCNGCTRTLSQFMRVHNVYAACIPTLIDVSFGSLASRLT